MAFLEKPENLKSKKSLLGMITLPFKTPILTTKLYAIAAFLPWRLL
jgi:hypothetical protein